MIDFPASIPGPSYTLDVEPEDRGIISQFEDGSQQSRVKFTRSRRTWTVNWNGMLPVEKRIFEEFYRNTTAGSANAFNFVLCSEVTGAVKETVTVRFASPPKFSLSSYNNYKVEATLREV